MKNLICLVLILFSTNVFAAQTGSVTSSIITPGGSNGITNAASPLSLPLGSLSTKTYYVSSNGASAAVNTTAGHYYSFAKQGGVTGQWSVPSGKIAMCMQLQYASNNTVSPSGYIQFGYATATFANDATTVTGGNCYSVDGNCTELRNGGFPIYTPTANIAPTTYNIPIIFDASATGANATIYPFFRTQSAQVTSLGMLCTETP